jgi:hypothetical protein
MKKPGKIQHGNYSVDWSRFSNIAGLGLDARDMIELEKKLRKYPVCALDIRGSNRRF